MNNLPHRTPRFHPFARSAALVGLVLAIALLMSSTAGFAVSEAESDLTSLGYPELRLVATDEGFEAPSEVAAGRSLVVLENRGTPGGPAAVSDASFLQLPAGVTLDELNQALFSDGAPVPEWFDEIVSTGGFNVEAGETGYAVLDLQPGQWYVGVGDTNPFVPLTVTEGGSSSADPPADLTIDLSEFAFDLPDQLPAGRQVWHGVNDSGQSHELTLVKTPELLTPEQVTAILALPEGAAPPPGVPDPATFEFLSVGLKTMSAGREIWVDVELTPGFYVAICVQTDPASGAPHAMLGMIDVFTVDQPGTETT